MAQQASQRIIGNFEGALPGPLILAIGALHGNEPAGVHALEMVFEQLELERRDNPDFQFRGRLVGIVGNTQAFLTRHRYIEQDLNRLWTKEFLEKLRTAPAESAVAERREALEIFNFFAAECQAYTGDKIAVLDLHTTSADGGVFSIPTEEGASLALARHLGAPAIVGLQDSISGTLLGFALQGSFDHLNPSRTPICVAFEAGQHDSPHAISRSVIALVRCLRAMDCIDQDSLTDFEQEITLPFLAYVPPVVRFRYAHHIQAEDGFRMRPGYVNFQPIQSGEHLADDVHGPVLSPDNGLILMPLYQAKGSDGFFIVQ